MSELKILNEREGVNETFSNKFLSIDVREGIAILTFAMSRRGDSNRHPSEVAEVVCRLALTRSATLDLLRSLNEFRDNMTKESQMPKPRVQ